MFECCVSSFTCQVKIDMPLRIVAVLWVFFLFCFCTCMTRVIIVNTLVIVFGSGSQRNVRGSGLQLSDLFLE